MSVDAFRFYHFRDSVRGPALLPSVQRFYRFLGGYTGNDRN
jgi:hypothetical protein